MTTDWLPDHIRKVEQASTVAVTYTYVPQRYADLVALAERSGAREWSSEPAVEPGAEAVFRATFVTLDIILNTTRFLMGLGRIP